MKRGWDDGPGQFLPSQSLVPSQSLGLGKGSLPKASNTFSSATPYCAKILCPPALGRAIMGKGGQNIRMIIEASGAKNLFLSDRDALYPDHRGFQWMTIQAMTAESLNTCTKLVIEKVEECVSSGFTEGLNLNNAMAMQIMIPDHAHEGVQSTSGAITANTGAVVEIAPEAKLCLGDPIPERLVTISGLRPVLEQAAELILLCVQEHNNKEWWPQWSARPPKGANKGLASIPVVTNGGVGTMNGRGFSDGDLMSDPAVAMMMNVAGTMPSAVKLDPRGFAINCTLPSSLALGLNDSIGEVMGSTFTRISIGEDDVNKDPNFKILTITGSIVNVCSGYITMMKKFLEQEVKSQSVGTQASGQPLAQANQMEQLLQQLQSQMGARPQLQPLS